MIHKFIIRYLCNNISTTLLLSRIIKLSDDIINSQLFNEEEYTSLIDYVICNDERRDNSSDDNDPENESPSINNMVLLKDHEYYSSIKKMLNRQWTSITLYDIDILVRLEMIYAYTRFRSCIIDRFECNGGFKYNEDEHRIDIYSECNNEHIVIRLYDSWFMITDVNYESNIYNTDEYGSELAS